MTARHHVPPTEADLAEWLNRCETAWCRAPHPVTVVAQLIAEVRRLRALIPAQEPLPLEGMG